jgi:hypothetical protein
MYVGLRSGKISQYFDYTLYGTDSKLLCAEKKHIKTRKVLLLKKNSVDLSPQANYTD